MRRPVNILLPAAVLASLAIASAAFGPCTEKRTLPDGLGSFTVRIESVTGPQAGEGTLASPYAFTEGETTLSVVAEARDLQGRTMDGAQAPPFNGDVALRIVPGELLAPGTRLPFVDGRAQIDLGVRKVFGRVALWLEDFRTVKGDVARKTLGSTCENCPAPARCDENNQCTYELQLRKKEGTWATGISRTLHFQNPSLRQIQWDPWIDKNDLSSLAGSYIDVHCRQGEATGPWQDDHGQVVVTGVVNEGFFVTDVADPTGEYNHLYVYNYSFPEGVFTGDRLDRLAGTASDFSGCTQVSFPSWLVATDEFLDPLPFRVKDLDTLIPPKLVDSATCREGGGTNQHLCGHSKQNWSMEKLESGRVRVENLQAPHLFVDCDFNNDLMVTADWVNPSDPESICMTSCLLHDGKTEITVPAGADELYVHDDARPEVITATAVVCPWEAGIENIKPNCAKVRIGPEFICSELTNLRQFGQWNAALDGGAGPLLTLVTNETWVQFDPAKPEKLGMHIDFAQGNLKQVRAARPRWMIMVGMAPGDVPDDLKQ